MLLEAFLASCPCSKAKTVRQSLLLSKVSIDPGKTGQTLLQDPCLMQAVVQAGSVSTDIQQCMISVARSGKLIGRVVTHSELAPAVHIVDSENIRESET